MNRRDFVKALAGIPLLGLLVKVPEKKEDVLETAYAELRLGAEKQPPYELSVGNTAMAHDGVLNALRASGLPWFYTTSSSTTNGPTMTYWDGQEWISMRVDCPRDWQYIGDEEPYLYQSCGQTKGDSTIMR